MTVTAAAPVAAAADVAELLSSGQCSASCLLSRPDSACRCRCLGRFHGLALGRADGGGA